MSWPLFERIIQDLERYRYAGWLAFHNYNEPLANPRLPEEIRLVRLHLPSSKPSIFTNGDLLNLGLMQTLADSGVAYLRITLYPSTAAPQAAVELARMKDWLQNRRLLDLCCWTHTNLRQGTGASTKFANMTVDVILPDLSRYNSRGGTVPFGSAKERLIPCRMASHSASIDFRGRLKMCCNVYPDLHQHSPYLIGNFDQNSFEELWNSEKMIRFRQAHALADWSLSPICARCTQRLPTDEAITNATSEVDA
jgi:MoaA/NifB/PqqE/SkfB family radical SAM enzyme